MALDDLDIALGHGAGEVGRDVPDHVFLAVDERRPVELRLADGDMMNGCPLDFVQGMAGGDQHLLWRAAPVRTGAAEKIGLDHRDRHSGAPDRAGHADAGVAATQNDHVEFLRCHRINPSVGSADAIRPRRGRSLGKLRAAGRRRYLRVMVEVIEPTTLVAISNWAVRSLMLWRFAIHPKSVHTAQMSPLSSCVSSSRIGQSRPAFGFEVMNCVPSGGLPNTSSVEGRSLMPASAASFDWSISMKNLMPLPAISALMRVIASAIGTALLTLTMPSSLSARAAETAERISRASSSEVQKLARRFVK